MQNILTEHVEIQGQQIEEIQETILAATENVQEGNEQVCLLFCINYIIIIFMLLPDFLLMPPVLIMIYNNVFFEYSNKF